MRNLTGKPNLLEGYTGLYSNEIHLKEIYNLDDVPDGAAGGYSRVLSTHLSAGKLLLTSAAVKSGKWYSESGVEIDATSGIALFGTDMALITAKSSTAITAFADGGAGTVTVTSAGHGLVAGDKVHIGGTTNYNGNYNITYVDVNNYKITKAWAGNDATGTSRRIEAYVGSDGKLVAGAGAVTLDNGGIKIYGDTWFTWYAITTPLAEGDVYLQSKAIKGLAKDKDGLPLPMWGNLGFIYVSGAWTPRDPAIYFSQWQLANEIDPISNTAKTVYLITKNIGRTANLDHAFAPSVDGYGELGTATNRWGAARVTNRLKIPVGVDKFD